MYYRQSCSIAQLWTQPEMFKTVLLLVLVAFISLQRIAPPVVAQAGNQVCPQSSLSQPSRLVKDAAGRLRGIRSPNETDFVIGILIPVHNPLPNSSGGACSNALTAQGVERVEVALYAIDCINNNNGSLPNGITLGYDIRDTCRSENIALDETLDLLNTETELQLEMSLAQNFTTPQKTDSLLLGLIGSATSGVTVPIASLLRLFSITQVSYLATTPLLNNRDRYRYFLRTVPPDNFQAEAMYRLALRFNWTLVSTISSNDAYGAFGIREFRTALSVENNQRVCIDFDESLDISFTREQYQNVVRRFLKDSQASVVILFSAVTVATGFLEALEQSNTSRRFIFLASDTITDSPVTVARFRSLLNGMYSFLPHSEPFRQFENFYTGVTRENNERNRIWYTEDCEEFFAERNLTCSAKSSVAEHSGYIPDVAGGLLVDAIYSFAHGINRFLRENCDKPVVWNRTTQTCAGQKRPLTRNLLLEEVQNSNFTSPSGVHVMFDSKGNRVGLYSIFNLLGNDSSTLNLSRVGFYNPTSQTIWIEKQIVDGQRGNMVASQCMLCPAGSIFVSVQGSCCGTCQPCLGNSSVNGSECSSCSKGQWGSNPLNGSVICTPLTEVFLQHSDVWGAVIIALSILGLLLVIFASVSIGIFWNTPVIKSSGREQMLLLLTGVLMCFFLPYFYIVKPSITICIFQRIGLWVCFSLIFGALFVKLLRIARIFLQRSNLERPRFIEPHYQIIFTLAIVAGQMVLAVISLVVMPPTTNTDVRSNEVDSNDFPTLVRTCQSPHLAMIILLVLYDTALIVLNNILALLTIRFPENFNEARHVSFATIAIAIVWIGFIPSYFATDIQFRAGVTAFAVITSAFAVLVCLFGPRIAMAYRFRWKKYAEKNDTKTGTMMKVMDSHTNSVDVLKTDYAQLQNNNHTTK